MAETSASKVFRGVEGSGAAQIFGSASNPINALMKVNQSEARRRATEQAAKQKRDEQIAELGKWNPDARWEPFDEQVRGMSAKLLEWETDQLEKGVDPNDYQF